MPLPLVIPLAIGAGAALMGAGGVGAAASGALGKSKRVDKYNVDPNRFTYGGAPGFADAFRQRLQAAGQAAGQRNVLSGTDRTVYGNGVADYNLGMRDYRMNAEAQREARARQIALADKLNAAVEGKAPSVAQEQMKEGTESAALNALNIAASSRGGGAGAAFAAQDANVMGAQRANRDAAMLRAGEIAQARGELAGVLSGVRGQDLQAGDSAQGAARLGQGLSQIGMQQQGIELQQQELALRQMGLNDEQIRAYLQGELQVNQGELQGNMAYGQADLQAALQQQQINAQLEEAARQRRASFWGGLFNAGAGVMGMGAAGAAKP